MSSRALRRTKSPANRNRFNDIGVTGRKTGVRVAGDVRVDEDGLENVDEFYKQTSPQNANDENQEAASKVLRTRTLHTLLSPTPIRSTANYDTLMGALDMPMQAKKIDPQGTTALATLSTASVMEDEVTVSPVQARAMRAHLFNTAENDSRGAANRRTTLAPSLRQTSRDADWMHSPRKGGRRVTMAFVGQNGAAEQKNKVELAEEEGDTSAADQDAEYNDQLSPEMGAIDAVKDGFVPGEDQQPGDAMDDDVPGNVIEDYSDGEAAEEPQGEDQAGEELVYSEDSEPDETSQQQQHADDHLAGDEVDVSGSESHEETALDDQVQQQQADETTGAESNGVRGTKQASKSRKALETEHPVRRSTRATIQPVAYWRNEHVEYEYGPGSNDGGAAVPKMKGVVRVRQTAEEKNQAKKRRVKRHAQNLPSLRGIKRSELDPDDRNQFFYYDDEGYGFPVSGDNSAKYGPKFVSPSRKSQGSQKRTIDIFDDDDDIPVDERPKVVVGPDGEQEVRQEVVISRQSIEWSNLDTKGDKYKVGLGLFMEEADGRVDASTGVLSIAVGGRKPPRNSSNKALFYLVTAGKVEVSIHSSKFKVGVLGQFMIPKYNSYSIENVGTHPAQLYYVNVCPPEPAVASTSHVLEQKDDEDSEDVEE